MFRSTTLLATLLGTFAAAAAHAQAKTDYSLNGDQVRFHVPAGWTAIMEKADGNPQAVAFQVPDASAQGSEDVANVTVKTRELKDASQFAATVQDEFERSKAQGRYEIDPSNKDNAIHQYFVVRGKTKYLVRDSFQLSGSIAVEVRCQRPLLASTPASWNAEFDTACGAVVASLKH
jgi:beta-galactosidase GanA